MNTVTRIIFIFSMSTLVWSCGGGDQVSVENVDAEAKHRTDSPNSRTREKMESDNSETPNSRPNGAEIKPGSSEDFQFEFEDSVLEARLVVVNSPKGKIGMLKLTSLPRIVRARLKAIVPTANLGFVYSKEEGIKCRDLSSTTVPYPELSYSAGIFKMEWLSEKLDLGKALVAAAKATPTAKAHGISEFKFETEVLETEITNFDQSYSAYADQKKVSFMTIIEYLMRGDKLILSNASVCDLVQRGQILLSSELDAEKSQLQADFNVETRR